MNDIVERLRSLYVQHGTDYVQEAADEIERLRAELKQPRGNLADAFARTKASAARLGVAIQEYEEKFEQRDKELTGLKEGKMRTEIERLRADAKRYRWLAPQFRCDPDMGGNHRWLSCQLRPTIRGNTIDAAIDAAMAAAPKPEE